MTLPSVVRVFFALDLPLACKEQISEVINALKKSSKSNAIRWTKPENLHITLQFLPEVRQEDLEKLLTSVRVTMQGHLPPMNLSFGKLLLFPHAYRPRVIVLDVLPQEGLAKLSACIGQGVVAAGYPIEDRVFRAHITLARIKQPQGVSLRFMQKVVMPPLSNILAEEVALFRSEPKAEGSSYSILDRIAM